MNTIATIASIVLGAVFVLAGASKLAAGPAWPAQARDLGAPQAAIRVLPWIEMVIGALLVVQITEPWPALVAIALLLAFSVFIVMRIREGQRPPCACFGAWSASPIGPKHLLRNAAFAVLGVLAALG